MATSPPPHGLSRLPARCPQAGRSASCGPEVRPRPRGLGGDALPVEEQEQAIGREKLSDIEFADEDKAANSHLVLNTIVDEDGEECQIMRFNMPFGRVGAGEFGTYFIGYARSPDVIEEMLTNFHRQAAGDLRPAACGGPSCCS
jgi:hypothetical protein